MKSFYLFLFLFLCSACSNSGKREVLDEELSKMPILSVSFDSLLSEVKKMSDQDRIASIIKISYRNEEEIDGIQKQKRLLIEVLPLSSGGNRKKILLQLVTIYSNLDRFGVSGDPPTGDSRVSHPVPSESMMVMTRPRILFSVVR